MKILRCEFKNFGSYGNKLHVIEMPDPAAFSLIVGANGRGKCLMPDTSIEVMLEDESELEKFKQFLSMYRQNGNNGNGKITCTLEELYVYEKLTSSVSNKKFYTDTKYGNRHILGVDYTAYKEETLHIETDSEHIEASLDHIFWKLGEEIKAKDLKVNDFIDTKHGESQITKISEIGKHDLMDIQVEEVHEFYANNIRSHNSTLSDVIKFGIYGKLETKKMKDIPNRLNKHTEIKIELQTRRGKVTIERGLEPGYFRLFLDGKHIDKAGKRSVQEFLEEELLEMPFYVFSNTLSLSINDFKSFIRMSNFDKRAIIDKIFGLQILNKMRDTLKSQTKRIKDEIEKLNSSSQAFARTLKSSEDELKSLEKRLLESRDVKLSELQTEQTKLTQFITAAKNKEADIKEKYSKSKLTRAAIDKSLSGELQYKKELSQQIKLYENSKCPVCASDLTTDFHKENLRVLQENLDGCEQRIGALREHQTKITEICESNEGHLNTIMKQISAAETQLRNTTSEIRSISADDQISEQSESIKKIVEDSKSNMKQAAKEKFASEKKVNFFMLIDEILGEKGIKQMAIKSILPSLNAEIQRLVSHLGIEHRIAFDEEFNAHITHFGVEVSPDTLSTGESKKVDFAVLLSIVRLMKLKYPGMNVIFLDEIFSSIDGDGIYHILKILRETVKELDLNTFVISHYPLTSTEFDYKIEIEKNKGFSAFTIEKVK